mmetsp:Transcript_7095/g.20782  ORF Transcript_7095/g.20782 Transcript_7095/m.20782 type:complete len:239 (-) Transcript_7095:1842-2558(-)
MAGQQGLLAGEVKRLGTKTIPTRTDHRHLLLLLLLLLLLAMACQRRPPKDPDAGRRVKAVVDGHPGQPGAVTTGKQADGRWHLPAHDPNRPRGPSVPERAMGHRRQSSTPRWCPDVVTAAWGQAGVPRRAAGGWASAAPPAVAPAPALGPCAPAGDEPTLGRRHLTRSPEGQHRLRPLLLPAGAPDARLPRTEQCVRPPHCHPFLPLRHSGLRHESRSEMPLQTCGPHRLPASPSQQF